jgi:cytochrome bd ubiquinol oxidase subunit II
MLETIWFLIWGILWAIYFMLDGFDLGLGMLLPFIAKNETEKRIIHGAVGPYWDGNEVWLITAGGVTFAAFPATYAVLFSAFYTPLMLILFALIIRAVSLEFRHHHKESGWRSFWDTMAAVGSFVPAFLFGVAFANIFKGIPIDTDGVFKGTLFTFLNPYGFAGGLFFLFFFLLHGTLWLVVKTDGPLQERAAALSKKLWIYLTVLAVVFLIMSAFYTGLYYNYLNIPLLFVLPLTTVCLLFSVRFFLAGASYMKAWWASSLTIIGTTLFGIAGLYPDMLPSSLNPVFSLNVFNSSSSPLTLKIMLVVALIFVPIVIIYQGWAYRFFKGKIREEDLGDNY